MNFSKILCLILTLNTATLVCGQNVGRRGPDNSLAAKIRRFSPTVLTANTSQLPAKDRLALQKIIAAAKLFDPLFLRQIWSGNETLKRKLEADKSVIGRMLLHYLLINDGP